MNDPTLKQLKKQYKDILAATITTDKSHLTDEKKYNARVHLQSRLLKLLPTIVLRSIK